MRTSHLLGTMLAACCCVALAACNDDVSFDATTEAPKVGTSIIGYQFDYDGNGQIQEHHADTVAVAVLAPASVSGKGSVVPFALTLDDPDGSVPTHDTIFAHYEPGGDVSIKDPRFSIVVPGGGPEISIAEYWVALPFGSKVTTTQVHKDTTFEFSIGGQALAGHVDVATTQQFIGPAILVTDLGALNVMGAKVHQVVTATAGALRYQTLEDRIIYYAPKLGAIVKVDAAEYVDNGGSQGVREVNHSGWQATSYTLVK